MNEWHYVYIIFWTVNFWFGFWRREMILSVAERPEKIDFPC